MPRIVALRRNRHRVQARRPAADNDIGVAPADIDRSRMQGHGAAYLDHFQFTVSVKPFGEGRRETRRHMLRDYHRPWQLLRQLRQHHIESGRAPSRRSDQDQPRRLNVCPSRGARAEPRRVGSDRTPAPRN